MSRWKKEWDHVVGNTIWKKGKSWVKMKNTGGGLILSEEWTVTGVGKHGRLKRHIFDREEDATKFSKKWMKKI